MYFGSRSQKVQTLESQLRNLDHVNICMIYVLYTYTHTYTYLSLSLYIHIYIYIYATSGAALEESRLWSPNSAVPSHVYVHTNRPCIQNLLMDVYTQIGHVNKWHGNRPCIHTRIHQIMYILNHVYIYIYIYVYIIS